MKKNDFIWGGVLLAIILFLAYPVTREVFESTTAAHPYIMGFVKVSILATMGELLAIRIGTGEFKKPVGVILRFIIWGLIGMIFVIAFGLFAGGVNSLMGKGLLPSAAADSFAGKLIFAFFTSMLMNLLFAPAFMAFHRITDSYIELGKGKISNIRKVKLKEVCSKIDWYSFISFVLLKTIPFFWIPAHTITFLLPEAYRVLVAAFLSLALGAILATAKRKGEKA